jgi:hypothetical protein
MSPLTLARSQVASHLGSHLAFGAKLAIRCVDINPPHHD